MRRRLSLQQQLILAFGFLIVLGSALLLLPCMTVGKGISVIDSVFTATSAVCVTGLTVVDTGTEFTFFGQLVILVLIQTGGLGIMTLSTAFILMLGKQVSMNQDIVMQEVLAHSPMKNLHRLVIGVFVFTLVTEFIGSIIYYFSWAKQLEPQKAWFFAVFHSVSAFCNAGFSLFPNSLADFQGCYVITLTTMFLIVLGGIGFLVLFEVTSYTKSTLFFSLSTRPRPYKILSLHTKITLITTFALLLFGFLSFFLIEYHDAMAGLCFQEKILDSAFQSVTARTAGFNTVNMAELSNSMLAILLVLMFVGASPGSCGGGVKTTTIAVVFALVRSTLQGKKSPSLFCRTIPAAAAARAMAVILAAAFLVVTASIALLLTQIGNTPHGQSRGLFLEYIFEVVSALGTVGLSMGITPTLNPWGKLIIIFVMFAGRLGPLTIAFSIRPKEDQVNYTYSEENVMIG